MSPEVQALLAKKDEIIDYLLTIYGHPKDHDDEDEYIQYQNLLNEESKLALLIKD